MAVYHYLLALAALVALAAAQTDCRNITTCPCDVPEKFFSDCVWCPSSASCIPGGTWGPTGSTFLDFTGTVCGGWRYKQCFMDGSWLIVAAIGIVVAFVALIIFFICCCCCGRCRCCCCRKSKVGRVLMQEDAEVREPLVNPVDSMPTSATPVTDRKRAELSMKYKMVAEQYA